jgi:hypothetical protein
MPGAPNKPPPLGPVAPPVPETPRSKVLRRIAPVRTVLRLEIWRGSPPRELLTPFGQAEAAFGREEYEAANTFLDQLATRLAEPRWPTLPEPFRSLRVNVVRPQPPHWDPDHGAPPEERDARRARRYAEAQVQLARATYATELALGTPVPELAELLSGAETRLAAQAPDAEFWESVDRIWSTLREKVPVPAPFAAPKASPPPPESGVATP